MTRYKVIADYPDSPYKVGQILTGVVIDKYPAIFKRLEWWEDVPIKELPMYLKNWYFGRIEKVSRYIRDKDGVTWVRGEGMHRIYLSSYLPSTEQEYNDYKKKNP